MLGMFFYTGSARADRHLDLAKQFVAMSELQNEVNMAIRVVDIRIGNLKARAGCEKNTECRKAVDSFERQYVTNKEDNKNKMLDQVAANLKSKFSEKELEWLISVYSLPTFKKYQIYVKDDSGRPGNKFSLDQNAKLDSEVQKTLGKVKK